MDPTIQERVAARAILFVAKGVCTVEFPTSCAGAPSKTVLIVRNAYKPLNEHWVPMTFNGDLWALIAKEIPALAAAPFTRDWNRDLIPLAIQILRDAVETWGTPTLEESPDHPAGQRTPGWSAAYDPFDP